MQVSSLSSNLFVFLDFSFVTILKQIKSFPFETKSSVLPVSTISKKNNCRCGPLCLVEAHLPQHLRHFAWVFSFGMTSGSTTKITFFNWDLLHARQTSHYRTLSYKKKKHKKIEVYSKSVQKVPVVKRSLLNLDLKPFTSQVKEKHSIDREFQNLAVQ